MADTARDVMTPDAQCIGENDSVVDAAKRLRDLNVGAMPICGEDDRLKGMLTDRDIVVKVLAEGKDPASTLAGELGEGKPVTIGADDSLDEALRTMTEHKIRRLPVIDGHELVGIISQADLARSIDESRVGDLVEAISTGARAPQPAPPTGGAGFHLPVGSGQAARRWSAGTSSLATAFASIGIWRSRNLAIRSSSRLMARANLAVSRSLTASARASIAV